MVEAEIEAWGLLSCQRVLPRAWEVFCPAWKVSSFAHGGLRWKGQEGEHADCCHWLRKLFLCQGSSSLHDISVVHVCMWRGGLNNPFPFLCTNKGRDPSMDLCKTCPLILSFFCRSLVLLQQVKDHYRGGCGRSRILHVLEHSLNLKIHSCFFHQRNMYCVTLLTIHFFKTGMEMWDVSTKSKCTRSTVTVTSELF